MTSFVSNSLYVGDLELNVGEAELYDTFNHVGPVLSIRVCRDSITKQSLGYAYVNYKTSEDAARALELLNFTRIHAKPIRVMFSSLDSSLRKSGIGNIFVKNLDRSIDSKALFDTFSAFGCILSCKVATDSSGESKGYGFVQFKEEASAQCAIERVNGMLLKGKKVFVGPFVCRQERDQPSDAAQFHNIFVRNIAEATTEEDLRTRFAMFGPISSAVLMKDSEGRSKCFGFINFVHADDATKAVQALNGKIFGEKEWYVGRIETNSEREAQMRENFGQDRPGVIQDSEGSNLYLKNLSDAMDDGKLKELFAEFGAITSCKVMRDSDGRSRGFGFVAFSKRDEAHRAIANMNGRMIGSKPLYVAFAQRKEERRARLEAQFAQKRGPLGMGLPVPPSLSFYHPGTAGLGIGQQFFYGQPPPGLLLPVPQQMLAGFRPGIGPGQLPSYCVPVVPRQDQQRGQRGSGARGGGAPQQQQERQHQPPQQILPRGGNHGFCNTSNARNAGASDAAAPPQGITGNVPSLSIPLQVGGVPVSSVSEEVPISIIWALEAALPINPPARRRAMLRMELYPLVDKLQHDHAEKVTKRLLEMDWREVLHLLRSPRALVAKVAETMETLRMAQEKRSAPAKQRSAAGLSLNEKPA